MTFVNRIYKFLVIQFLLAWILFSFIPKSYFKRLFVVEIILFFVVILCCNQKIVKLLRTQKARNLLWCFLSFFVVATIYLAISYKNLPNYWQIHLLLFDKAYVYRHFMIIAEHTVPIGLGYAIYKSNILFEVKNKYLAFLLVFLFFVVYIWYGGVIKYAGLIVALLSLIAIRTNQKLLVLLVFFVFRAHSAYILASMGAILLLLFRKELSIFFSKRATFKMAFVLLIILIGLIIFQKEIYQWILSDANSLWRLKVWANEIETLMKTRFTGVGFGAAYVTYDIYTIVDNPNMYFESDGETLYDGLFLVANHNSFLNMFYRMGVVGGTLFVVINILACSCAIERFRGETKILRSYTWWAFSNYVYNLIVVFLNPGLEMMQFAINYMFSFAVLISLIFKVQEAHYSNGKNRY